MFPKIILIWLVSNAEAARILAMFPAPSLSHQYVFRPFTQELAARGHEVVVITPLPALEDGHSLTNYKEINVFNVSNGIRKEYVQKRNNENVNDCAAQQLDAIRYFFKVFVLQIKSEQVQKLIIENSTFDLILAESYVRPTLALSHIFKAPIILVSSIGITPDINSLIGAPSNLMYAYGGFNDYSIWNKWCILYSNIKLILALSSDEDSENKILQSILPGLPDLSELRDNIAMVFFNSHIIWDNNHPMPSNAIHLGFNIRENPADIIPEDLQAYLNSSSNGVIYLSFGTNVLPSTIYLKGKDVLNKVFNELPYNVVCKWDTEADNIPIQSKNVKIYKWLPQVNLLRHPNVKLFITHGGLRSTEEAIGAGVPVIGIPMHVDQWYNTNKYVYHGIGKEIKPNDLTETNLKNAIKDIMENDRYRNNIVRLRSLMQDEPQRPLERAVWWTEHVLRHGGAAHLRAPAANMHWTQYYELKLVLIILVIIFLHLITSVMLLRILYKCIRKRLTGYLRKNKLKIL